MLSRCRNMIFDLSVARNFCLFKTYSSKIGRKWTQDNLLTSKIKVDHQDLETFFGTKDFPPPDVEPEALAVQDFATTIKDVCTANMLFQMSRITNQDPANIVSSTSGFVRELLNVVHYTDVVQRRVPMINMGLFYLSRRGEAPGVGRLHYRRLHFYLIGR